MQAMSEAPDWSTLTREIFCPLCGYNLRGLLENRCPECGHRFDWHALLNPPPAHPFLFDNNPSLKNFVTTWFATSSPWRFWSTVSLLHVIRLRWLAVYYLASSVLIVFGVLPRIWHLYLATGAGYRSRWERVLEFLFLERGQEGALWTILFWPPLTFLALMVFRASMRRAKVRTAHVVRAVIYSADFALPAMFGASLIPASFSRNLFFFFYSYRGLPILLSFPLAVLTTLRLGAAYDRYLGFRRPYLIALSTQGIVALVVAIVAVN